jgi:dihydroflavonol-4-reductase
MPASYVSLAWGLLLGKVPRFTPAAVKALQAHRLVSHEKATRELGYRPRPFEETVRDVLEWFSRAGLLEG